MTSDPTPTPSHCTACGAPFVCGAIAAGLPTCWCMTLPALVAADLDAAAGCYCPDCLQQRIASAKDAATPPAVCRT